MSVNGSDCPMRLSTTNRMFEASPQFIYSAENKIGAICHMPLVIWDRIILGGFSIIEL